MVAGLHVNPRYLSLHLGMNRRRVPRLKNRQILGGIRDFHRRSNLHLHRQGRRASACRIVGRALLAAASQNARYQRQQQSGLTSSRCTHSHPAKDRYTWTHTRLPDLKSYDTAWQGQRGERPSIIRSGEMPYVIGKFPAAASRNRGNRFSSKKAQVAARPSVPADRKTCLGIKFSPPRARRQTPRPAQSPLP